MLEILCASKPCGVECPLTKLPADILAPLIDVLQSVQAPNAQPDGLVPKARVDPRELIERQIRSSKDKVFEYGVKILHLSMPTVAAVGATAVLRNLRGACQPQALNQLILKKEETYGQDF